MKSSDGTAKTAGGWISDVHDLAVPFRAGQCDGDKDAGASEEEVTAARSTNSGAGRALLWLFFGLTFAAGCAFLVIFVQGVRLEWRVSRIESRPMQSFGHRAIVAALASK